MEKKILSPLSIFNGVKLYSTLFPAGIRWKKRMRVEYNEDLENKDISVKEISELCARY